MRLIFTLLLITSTAFADPYTDETLRRLHEVREAGEFGGLQLEELDRASCNALASNISMGGAEVDQQAFVKECAGKSVSILQQIETPELPRFVDVAIVTYINYGNIPFAVERPQDFFANGNFFFDGMVANATKVGCEFHEKLRDERAEIASRFMVNELIAYDVRITYKDVGIISIRYFLNGDTDRHDYNYTCE